MLIQSNCYFAIRRHCYTFIPRNNGHVLEETDVRQLIETVEGMNKSEGMRYRVLEAGYSPKGRYISLSIEPGFSEDNLNHLKNDYMISPHNGFEFSMIG